MILKHAANPHYTEPSLERFKCANSLRVNGMNEQGRLPNDLALKFSDGNFENVNVIHIVKDDQSLKWYVLDEKN